MATTVLLVLMFVGAFTLGFAVGVVCALAHSGDDDAAVHARFCCDHSTEPAHEAGPLSTAPERAA
jgi:hypothetical protein